MLFYIYVINSVRCFCHFYIIILVFLYSFNIFYHNFFLLLCYNNMMHQDPLFFTAHSFSFFFKDFWKSQKFKFTKSYVCIEAAIASWKYHLILLH